MILSFNIFREIQNFCSHRFLFMHPLVDILIPSSILRCTLLIFLVASKNWQVQHPLQNLASHHCFSLSQNLLLLFLEQSMLKQLVSTRITLAWLNLCRLKMMTSRLSVGIWFLWLARHHGQLLKNGDKRTDMRVCKLTMRYPEIWQEGFTARNWSVGSAKYYISATIPLQSKIYRT